MFDMTRGDNGIISLKGRFDASQIEAARAFFERITESCTLDFGELVYISSAGLGLLFATQKRLVDAGEAMKLVKLNPHIREIFQIAGFDNIFEIG
jgi:anti-sigma B factor antagonist